MALVTLFWAEVRRRWLLMRAYWVDVLADQALFIIGFVIIAGLFDLVAGGNFDGWARLSTLIGYLTWRVAGGCLVEIPGLLAIDARQGTLEQLWLNTPYPALVLLLRSGVLVLYYSGRVLLMAAIILPLLRIPLPVAPGAVLIYLLTIGGVVGLGFALAGLHLVTKNVSSIAMPLGTILLFLTGAMVSLEGIPYLYEVSRLLPLSIGIDLLRLLLVDGQRLGTVMQSPAFAGLLLNTTVYAILGAVVFRWALARSRLDGSLAHY